MTGRAGSALPEAFRVELFHCKVQQVLHFFEYFLQQAKLVFDSFQVLILMLFYQHQMPPKISHFLLLQSLEIFLD